MGLNHRLWGQRGHEIPRAGVGALGLEPNPNQRGAEMESWGAGAEINPVGKGMELQPGDCSSCLRGLIPRSGTKHTGDGGAREELARYEKGGLAYPSLALFCFCLLVLPLPSPFLPCSPCHSLVLSSLSMHRKDALFLYSLSLSNSCLGSHRFKN